MESDFAETLLAAALIVLGAIWLIAIASAPMTQQERCSMNAIECNRSG
jgi:hypothetical protein